MTALPYDHRPAPESPELRPAYQGANPISDVWASRAIEMGAANLVRVLDDPADEQARGAMLLAASFAGVGFGNAGTHLAHAMSYPVSGMVRDYLPEGYPPTHPLVPHGMSVVLNAPAVFRFTAPADPERHRLAAELMGLDTSETRTDEVGDLLAGALIAFMQKAGMPNGLSAVGYGPKDVDQLGRRHPATAHGHQALTATRERRGLAPAVPGVDDALVGIVMDSGGASALQAGSAGRFRGQSDGNRKRRPTTGAPSCTESPPGVACGLYGRLRRTDGDTMSKATRTDTQSPAPHPADSHDLIRVQGARENNLKDVSVEIPKRRLTVFTGVSGSGKSSLVFGTIAAESQRLINETYSAFVQGFMPTLARPEVDVLEGLTTAIIVDQERMGANSRSTVGTATDANAMLRVLFSRLGKPHIGSPRRLLLQRPVGPRGRGDHDREGQREKTEKRTFTVTGGMCPRCEGMGSVTDIDLSQLYDDTKSLNEGALTIPGYTVDGWYVRIFSGLGLLRPGQADPQVHQEGAPGLPLQGADQGEGRAASTSPTRGWSRGSRSRSCPRTSTRCSRTSARSWSARSPSPPVPSAAAPGSTRPPGPPRSRGINIADACAMQISDLAEWVRGLDEPSVAPLLATLRQTLDSFVEIGLGYLSLDRPSGTLSGGEAQRTKMIRHLGSSLTDVTYVFDEPTIGLHPHDIQRMNGCCCGCATRATPSSSSSTSRR